MADASGPVHAEESNRGGRMPLIAKQDSKVYQLAPADVHRAVCVDVVDLGMVRSELYGRSQHKCRIVWEIEEPMEDGRPFLVGRRFTLSLNEKSALRPFLEAWRGRAFVREELEGFDIERLLGASCLVQVQHITTPDGRTFANVVSVMKLTRGMAPLTPFGSYVRVKDREPKPSEDFGDVPPEEEDAPF